MQLNKWLGSDKPKKDDFNYDNQKIDDACRLLTQSVEQLQYEQQNGASAQALSALAGTVSAHTSDTDIHITQAEKDAWSSGAGFLIGSYTGTGTASQKITLGFQPQFGLIYISGDGIGRVSFTTSQYLSQCGMISALGCSLGITLNSDGFTVEHMTMGGMDGFSLKLNTQNAKYIYFLWK